MAQRSLIASLCIGVTLGLVAALLGGQSVAAPAAAPVMAPLSAHIPETLGFYNEALWERYPLYYCMEPGDFSGDDHSLAADALTTAWGWGGVNRTIATHIQERCDEPPRVTVHFKLHQLCDPSEAAACVTFSDWRWLESYRVWIYGEATVWVDPAWWARSTRYWRLVLIVHEFGHAGMSLADTARQPNGVTVMDYNWNDGNPPSYYPTYADIVVTNEIYGPYKDPAWCVGAGQCPKRE